MNILALGDGGDIESTGESITGGCKWLLRVDDGNGIKLSIESFSVKEYKKLKQPLVQNITSSDRLRLWLAYGL